MVTLVVTLIVSIAQTTIPGPEMKSFWRLIEGDWARNIANRLSTPKERKQQNSLDYDRIYTVCRMRELLVAKGHDRVAPEGPLSHHVNYSALLMETGAMPFMQQKVHNV